MRYYTVTLMHGFSVFKCPICKHSVTTQEFSSLKGNCRTQAARAMNEHAAAAHSRPMPMLHKPAHPVALRISLGAEGQWGDFFGRTEGSGSRSIPRLGGYTGLLLLSGVTTST